MKYPISKHFVVLIVFFCSSISFAGQFYVFPVKLIEGINSGIDPSTRPLIDKKVRQLLPDQLQIQILDKFAKKLASVYPQSTVSSMQVGDSLKNLPYKNLENVSVGCGDVFSVPVLQTYAVVIGLTRASWYEVERIDGVNLDVVSTLNIQLIKPETGKVVFSDSQTLSSPFHFGSKQDLINNSRVIKDRFADGVIKQVEDLVDKLKKGFEPKDITVKILGQSNGYFIANKGFEVGFVEGDNPEAINKKNNKTVFFKVESVSSGYALLKPTEGEVNIGDEFTFEIDKDADDSSKPKIMPVISNTDLKLPVLEYFSPNATRV